MIGQRVNPFELGVHRAREREGIEPVPKSRESRHQHRPNRLALEHSREGSRGWTVAAPDARAHSFLPQKLDRGKEEILQWDGQEARKDLTLSPGTTVAEAVLDPDEELLDIDRTNNRWPRHVNVKPVPLYLGLYDLPVFLPDDSYNLVFGPELANSGIGVKASLQKPYDQNLYAASDYEFGEQLSKSRIGYQVNNLFHSQTAAGFELFNTNDLEDDDDLAGGKIYLRKELWPAPYGLGAVNDHITFYVLRDRSLGSGGLTSGGLEDSRNISYLRKDEAIIGSVVHFGRYGPYPDPKEGYQVDTFVESSGHFLGATQYFYRAAVDAGFYRPVATESKLAFRLKYGWGFPDDKNLFELGGINGLRGFDRKTVRGAGGLLGSVEYRFPLLKNLDLSCADHVVGLESIGGVAFLDGGGAWYDSFSDTDWKQDLGLGLRFTVNIGSFLEKIMVRMDVAQAVGESKSDPHFWFGVNHAF